MLESFGNFFNKEPKPKESPQEETFAQPPLDKTDREANQVANEQEADMRERLFVSRKVLSIVEEIVKKNQINTNELTFKSFMEMLGDARPTPEDPMANVHIIPVIKTFQAMFPDDVKNDGSLQEFLDVAQEKMADAGLGLGQ